MTESIAETVLRSKLSIVPDRFGHDLRTKLKTTCDFLCHECFKNVYFVGVRNFEGENHPGHTVITD